MADNIRPVIHQIEAEGYSSLRDIAEQLNRRGGVSKPRGAGYGVRQRSRTFRTGRTFSPVSHGGCCGMKNLHVLLMVSLLTFAGGMAIAQDYDAGLKAFQAGDFQTALKEWKPLADQGHAYAQNNLGWMYADGEGVPEDDAEAVRWYRLAADQGHADAQNSLGLMYADGEGVVEDDAGAVRWYRLAADQGFADAQNNLGWMYDNGEGVVEDDAEAAGWYRLAADQGLAGAQLNLGVMYANGEGVLQDNVTAHMWFNIAGANGAEDGRDNREKIERKMTPADISEAQKRARICMASNYTDCE